jgi:hypothetical protein
MQLRRRSAQRSAQTSEARHPHPTARTAASPGDEARYPHPTARTAASPGDEAPHPHRTARTAASPGDEARHPHPTARTAASPGDEVAERGRAASRSCHAPTRTRKSGAPGDGEPREGLCNGPLWPPVGRDRQTPQQAQNRANADQSPKTNTHKNTATPTIEIACATA